MSATPAVHAHITTRADEAEVRAVVDQVSVRVGELIVYLTADAATRLSNQLTDAVDKLDGKGAER